LPFWVFEKVEIKSVIIFTTAYDEHALRAFKLNRIDCILKSIDEDDLEAAVKKFQTRIPKEDSLKMNFDEIRKMLFNPFEKNYKKRFTVRVGQHLKVILVEEIECVYGENKGTYIHTFDNRNYLIESSLELLEQKLEPKEFYRIIRKFIIPLKAIKEIVIYSNSRLKVVLLSYTSD